MLILSHFLAWFHPIFTFLVFSVAHVLFSCHIWCNHLSVIWSWFSLLSFSKPSSRDTLNLIFLRFSLSFKYELLSYIFSTSLCHLGWVMYPFLFRVNIIIGWNVKQVLIISFTGGLELELVCLCFFFFVVEKFFSEGSCWKTIHFLSEIKDKKCKKRNDL